MLFIPWIKALYPLLDFDVQKKNIVVAMINLLIHYFLIIFEKKIFLYFKIIKIKKKNILKLQIKLNKEITLNQLLFKCIIYLYMALLKNNSNNNY